MQRARGRWRLLATGLFLAGVWEFAAAGDNSVSDLYYGEALYYAYQEDYFDSIVRLDTELAQHYELDQPELDTLYPYKKSAEFSVGDLELNYRMHQRAGRAIQRVLDAEGVPPPVRSEAAYRLARIYYAEGDYINATHALNLAKEPPQNIADEIVLLKAQIEMTQGNFEHAVELLRPIRKSDSERVRGYAPYNLGVALIQAGDFSKGSTQLSEVGTMAGDSRDMVALRDKANLTLGNYLLELGLPDMARGYLERVSLRGPLSNRALLWAGWADMALKNYQRALVPWTELQKRDPTDAAVQEALLALPYAYAQLEAYSRAALLYGEAVDKFDTEISRLDSSMDSIHQGKLRQALLKDPKERNSRFFESLRQTPDAPETRYLLDLMAGHNFQESVKNYRDLESLRLNLENWLANIKAYEDLIEMRRRYYQPLLPSVESQFKTQDALLQSVLIRREEVARQLTSAQRQRDTWRLAGLDELAAKRKLDQLQYRAGRLPDQPGLEKARARIKRLQGVLQWQVNTGYDNRLKAAYVHLKDLDQSIGDLRVEHQKIVRLKREAYQSFEGYEAPFRQMATRLNGLLQGIRAAMLQQAAYLEKAAVGELDRRRRKLADYRVKARFALAESYDRATTKQAKEATEELRGREGVQEKQIEDQPVTKEPAQ
ncbi:MAG TPA: tetratricopeptide repeat protein [Gammaproteobacteria bacterium]|nr:tetratricopeptide repeat protein [Gammaproteobacteria bacterium]